MSKAAIGAKTIFSFGEETVWGTNVTPTKVIEITSEGVTQEIGALISAGLNANRAITNKVQGNKSPGGDINFEQNTEGQTTLMKHALGRGISAASTDGGVRTVLIHDATAGDTTLVCQDIPSGFPGGTGEITLIFENTTTGVLSKEENLTYTSRTPTIFTFGTGPTLAANKGSHIFLYDASYANVNTHYIEAYKDLPTGLTFEIQRDIVVFEYSGVKINTLSETFNNGEIITSTLEILAKDEFSGTYLTAAAAGSASTLTVNDTSDFPTSGTLIVGTERDVAYTGKTATTFTTVTGLDTSKLVNTAVGLQEGIGAGLTAVTTLPLSSFQAGVYLDDVFIEVLNASYSITNTIFADKFALGSQFRQGLFEQDRIVEGTLNVEFDDLDLYEKFINDRQFKLEIRSITTTQIGSTGVFHQKHIVFPACKMKGTTPVAGGKELIVHDMPFDALRRTDLNLPEMYMIYVNTETSF